MKRIQGLFALLVLVLLFIPTPSAQQQGNFLYVNNTDPTCGGNSPCFSTIQAAVDAVLPGGAIQIQAGTYQEQVNISQKNNSPGASEADRIIIEADPLAPLGSVVVQPPAAFCLSGQAVLIRQSKFVTLRGLTIAGASGAGVVLLGGRQQNQAIHVERSRIFGNGSPSCPVGGIVIALGNPDTLIVNNLIHGNGGSGISFGDDANFTYTYDTNGNVTQKTDKITGAFTLYEYDAENKLVRVVLPNGDVVKYEYDALGRRVEKKVYGVGGGSYVNYVYDNEDILLEVVGLGGPVGFELQAKYTHGPGIDEPLIIEKDTDGDFVPDTSLFYHADGLGSITELTDATGALAQSYTYSSFGKIESQLDPNFVQPYTFTGREFEPETGLYFYRARYYDPNVGRFLAGDPIGFGGGDINLYLYLQNNPTGFTDPSGLILAQVVGGVIGGVVGGISASFVPGATGIDIFQGIAVGIAAGVLSTIPIPGVNPLLTGAAAGLLGNLGSQIFVENTAITQLDAVSATLSVVSGGLGGAAGVQVGKALSRTNLPQLTRDSLEAFGSGVTSAVTDVSLQTTVKPSIERLCRELAN